MLNTSHRDRRPPVDLGITPTCNKMCTDSCASGFSSFQRPENLDAIIVTTSLCSTQWCQSLPTNETAFLPSTCQLAQHQPFLQLQRPSLCCRPEHEPRIPVRLVRPPEPYHGPSTTSSQRTSGCFATELNRRLGPTDLACVPYQLTHLGCALVTSGVLILLLVREWLC